MRRSQRQLRAAASDADAFDGIEVERRAVLVQTGWSRNWNTEAYYEGHPYLTEAAAVRLRDGGATLVGIDTYNIDDTCTNSSRASRRWPSPHVRTRRAL